MKNQGFTMLELMMVLAVVAVLLGLASVPYSRYKKTLEVQQAAQTFAFNLERARGEAKRMNATRNMTLDTTTGSYTISDNLTPNVTSSTTTLPAGVQVTSSNTTVSFYPPYGTTMNPNGTMDPTLRTYTFSSTQDASIQKTVSVIGVIGTVIVK